MSHKTVESLPSLAHPLIPYEEQGGEIDEDRLPLRLPPFPEIDLNWNGFTIPHLQWIGINQISVIEDWRIQAILLHEKQHVDIGFTPLSQFKKSKILEFYTLMLSTFEDGLELIPVPLSTDRLKTNLQERWNEVGKLDRDSILIEEVHAVRQSLLEARDSGLINNRRLKKWITQYEEGYKKLMPLFPFVYKSLDRVGRHLGEHFALYMIRSAFETITPTIAFLDMYFHLIDELRTLNYSNTSREQIYDLFSSVINKSKHKPDFQRERLLDNVENYKRQLDVAEKATNNDFYKFLFGTPKRVLYTGYTSYTYF